MIRTEEQLKMNRVRSFMTLSALITHAYCIGCVGLGVPGIGITGVHHAQGWTLSRGEPFVCTSVNINKHSTEAPSSIAVSGSFAIESTLEETHTSQGTLTGTTRTQSTLQTTSESNVSPTNGTLQMASDQPTEKTATEEFVGPTLPIPVSSTSEKEQHATSETSTQGMTTSRLSGHTTVENQTTSTSPMTSYLSIEQTENTTTDSFDETTVTTSTTALETTTDWKTSSTPHITTDPTTEQIDETTTVEVRQTTTITTTVALKTTTDSQTSSTPQITTDPTTERKTTTVALETTTDTQTSSTPQITTDPTTEQKTTTVALVTTTDSQTSSTPQITTDPTTEQKTTTVGLTTLAAADRVCHHSMPPYCYEFIYEKKTYAEAYHSCRRLGAGSNLVSMVDAQKADDVKALIAYESSEPTEDYWIGLGSARYSWEDGKTVLYHNFASDYVYGLCTVMNKGDFKWKSKACTSDAKTICESDKASQSCDVEFQGSCYFVASSSTQATAKTSCENSGGYLLQIETKAEQLFIQNQISIEQGIWIGLKSDGSNGFTWTDGASCGYNNFGSEYKNNFGVCFRIDYDDGFHWNDDACDTLHNFICKWNL